MPVRYSFQSQTCFTKFAMLTFLFFMSCIHGCSSIRQGVARRGGSFSRLKDVSEGKGNPVATDDIPAFDKVLEVLGPLDAVLGLVLQLGYRLADNIGEKIDQPGSRLHLRPIGREGEPMLRNLQQGHTQRPDVRSDGVRLTCDTFWRHVVGGADERIGIALGAELAADTKVAELDLAIATQKDV